MSKVDRAIRSLTKAVQSLKKAEDEAISQMAEARRRADEAEMDYSSADHERGRAVRIRANIESLTE